MVLPGAGNDEKSEGGFETQLSGKGQMIQSAVKYHMGFAIGVTLIIQAGAGLFQRDGEGFYPFFRFKRFPHFGQVCRKKKVYDFIAKPHGRQHGPKGHHVNRLKAGFFAQFLAAAFLGCFTRLEFTRRRFDYVLLMGDSELAQQNKSVAGKGKNTDSTGMFHDFTVGRFAVIQEHGAHAQSYYLAVKEYFTFMPCFHIMSSVRAAP